MTAFFVYFVILKILPNPSFVKEGLDVNKAFASDLCSRLVQQL